MNNKPLVDRDYRLEKSPGMGGWTYTIIPEIAPDPPTIPEELLLCIRDDAEASRFFDSLTEGRRHQYARWIGSAKTDRTRVERIARTVGRLARHLKFSGKEFV